jgi:hypothetical protein
VNFPGAAAPSVVANMEVGRSNHTQSPCSDIWVFARARIQPPSVDEDSPHHLHTGPAKLPYVIGSIFRKVQIGSNC